MAKFLSWSDLHLEFENFEIPRPGVAGAPSRDEIDGILLPGDINVKGMHVDFMKAVFDIWERPVLAVAGNHEPYGAKRFQKHLAQEHDAVFAARSDGYDIEVLRMGERIIGDTRVLGTTLWTNLALWGPAEDWVKRTVQGQMNDYARVRFFDERTGVYRKMIPADTIRMHEAELQWLLTRLDAPFAGPTIVMTHHLPARELLAEHRLAKRDIATAAYASDHLDKLMGREFSFWVSGHSHDAREGRFSGPRGDRCFLSNIRGYPGEHTGFDPIRILDSHEPQLVAERDAVEIEEAFPAP